jgi:hypothetical protein
MPIFWKFKLKKSYKPHLSASLPARWGQEPRRSAESE